MKALYKSAPGPHTSSLVDRPVPQLNERDNVRVKVQACTVCGMDVHIHHGKFPCDPPFIMGHEMVGTVESLGSNTTGRLKVGDRVVSQPHLYACGICDQCKNGLPQFCADKRSLGISRDGAMAEFVVIPEEYLHKIPACIPDELACLLEPFTILVSDVLVYGALERGETVAVIGAGQIGQLAVVAARAGGASKVFVTGAANDAEMRLPAALRLGADLAINSQTEDTVGIIMEQTGGKGVDLVVECSGNVHGINNGLAVLRAGGRMTVLGGSKQESIAVNWDVALKKALDLRFHMMSDYQHMNRAIDIFAGYTHGDLSALISHQANLEDWEAIFELLTAGKGIKACLKI